MSYDPEILSIAKGGTSASSAANARTNLGAASSGANSDITSLASLSTPLSIAQGGTGSSTAAGARANLGVATSFNVYSELSGTASSTSGVETTLHSVTFTAPSTGSVVLIAGSNATLAGNNQAMTMYVDISGGPSTARTPFTQHVHTAVHRGGYSMIGYASGLTPATVYTARIRWIGPSLTTRSCSPGVTADEKAFILIENIG